jgi:lipid-A-disaccharide synthase
MNSESSVQISTSSPLKALVSPIELRHAVSIFITVAEPSADQHAAHLIEQLHKLRPDLTIEAIGGEKMRQAGAIIHHESVSGAAMGWRAALRAGEVARWLRWTDNYFAQHKPALHIACDSWSMNWRFARLARRHGIPVLYYIAPQTWASREGRIDKIRRYVDKLACILPFEEQYFRQHGIDATYVGHPLFDELPVASISPSPGTPGEGRGGGTADHRGGPYPNPPQFDSAHYWPEYQGREQSTSFTIGLLPGSRTGIAAHNFPHQLNIAHRISTLFPTAKFLVPTTPVTHEIVSKYAANFPNLSIDLNGFDRVVPQCDFCITVSGTAALHIAAYNVPFIVVYRVNPLHWHLVGRWVVKTRTYSLVNILSGRPDKIVPEFIPWYGSNKIVADAVIDYLQHPEKMIEQKRALQEMLRPLARPGAARNVAELALEMIR